MKIGKINITPALLSVWISAGAALFARLFLAQSYMSSTEGTYAAMANGLLGSRSAALPGQSSILGRIYRFLYVHVPAVPWYTCVLFGVGAAALAVIGYTLISMSRETDKKSLLLLHIALTGYFTVYLMCSLSSMTAACAAAAAGFLLIVRSSTGKKGRILTGIVGVLFCLASSLLQRTLFFVAAAVLLTALAQNILNICEEKRGGIFLRFAVMNVCVLLMAAGLYLTEKRAKGGSDDAVRYVREAELAQTLQQYGLPNYERSRELYESIGISKSAWRYYKETGNYDFASMSDRNMEELLAACRRSPAAVSSWKTFFRECTRAADKKWFFSGAVTVLLLWLVLKRKSPRQTAGVLAQMLLLFVLCGLLWCRLLLPGPDCAPGIALIFSAVCMIGLSGSGSVYPRGRAVSAVWIALVLLSLFTWRGQSRRRNSFLYYRWKTNYDVLGTIRADGDHLYLRGGGVLEYENCLDPWKGSVSSVAYNTASLGMQDLAAEDREWIRDEFQVENPWTDMVNNEKVLLIDDDIKETMRYLKKQYKIKAREEEVGKLDDRSVYRIVSSE